MSARTKYYPRTRGKEDHARLLAGGWPTLIQGCTDTVTPFSQLSTIPLPTMVLDGKHKLRVGSLKVLPSTQFCCTRRGSYENIPD